MIDPKSRYRSVGTVRYTMEDGREVLFIKRRLLPEGGGFEILTSVRVEESDRDRLDRIAERTLGDPLGFWLICDANDAVSPYELTQEPGTKIRIPVPRI